MLILAEKIDLGVCGASTEDSDSICVDSCVQLECTLYINFEKVAEKGLLNLLHLVCV